MMARGRRSSGAQRHRVGYRPWIAASAAAWVVLAMIHAWSSGMKFPPTLNDQAEFEHALVEKQGDRPRFCNITVYPVQERESPEHRRTAFCVTGDYAARRPDSGTADSAARWFAHAFDVPEGPYRPILDPATFNRPGKPDFGARFRAIENPTVLDYLNVLHDAAGVQYGYAWWHRLRGGTAVVVGSGITFVALGIPAFLNATSGFTRMFRRSKATRESDRPDRKAQPGGGPPHAADSKRFGAGNDDFYPTECHAGERASVPASATGDLIVCPTRRTDRVNSNSNSNNSDNGNAKASSDGNGNRTHR